MSESIEVTVDVGQSTTKVQIDAGAIRVVQRGGHRLVDASAAEDFVTLVAALVPAGAHRGLSIAVSTTGYPTVEPLAAEISKSLLERTGARRVIIADDVYAGYLGAIGPAVGVVVTAGTGAVALSIGPDRHWSRCDGRGHLLGDLGSGFWTGRQGLMSALEWDESGGGSQQLAERAERRFGSKAALYEAVYTSTSPARTVAAFARDVVEAAQHHDRCAAAIVERAGRLLARTAQRAATAQAVEEGTASIIGAFGTAEPVQREFAACIPNLLGNFSFAPPLRSTLSGASALHRIDHSWLLAGLTVTAEGSRDD